MRFFCCDERRRSAVLAHPVLNGIDFLDVESTHVTATADIQAIGTALLKLHFLKDLAALSPDNVKIEGKDGLSVISLDPSESSRVWTVTLGAAIPDNDGATLTLRLRDGDDLKLDHLDPILRAIDFSLPPSPDADCKATINPLKRPATAADIDYLSKDFASFRRLMLDRLSVLMPDWQTQTPADLGMTLVELLAYVGDYLTDLPDCGSGNYPITI